MVLYIRTERSRCVIHLVEWRLLSMLSMLIDVCFYNFDSRKASHSQRQGKFIDVIDVKRYKSPRGK